MGLPKVEKNFCNFCNSDRPPIQVIPGEYSSLWACSGCGHQWERDNPRPEPFQTSARCLWRPKTARRDRQVQQVLFEKSEHPD